MRAQRCRSCGEEVRFVRMTSGSYMPLNPEPDDELGNVSVCRGAGRQLPAAELAVAKREQRALYVAHFATCSSPDVARARSARRPHDELAERRERKAQLTLMEGGA